MDVKAAILILITILTLNLSFVSCGLQKKAEIKDQILSTGLLVDRDDDTLLISTLDGALHAVTKQAGSIKWTLRDDPVIKNPTEPPQSSKPRFFPNPQDGSLYRYTMGRGRDPLKKLPFTIPQLVANSPCRSSDGIFYLGKKLDTWVGVDAITGKKQLVLGVDNVKKMCPHPSRNTIYLGRTLYNIILYEPVTGNTWNISFYDYSTNTASAEAQNYDLVHYTSTGEGQIITVDQNTGSLQWTQDFGSPLVAMYLLSSEGSLLSVPITTVAPQTLSHFTDEFMSSLKGSHENQELLTKKLSPTIYIGESNTGIYAVPAFVDDNTATIAQRQEKLLLSGPDNSRGTIENKPITIESGKVEVDEDESDIILLGYYDLPDKLKTELMSLPVDQKIESSKFISQYQISHENNSLAENNQKNEIEESISFWNGIQQFKNLNSSFIFSKGSVQWLSHLRKFIFRFLYNNFTNVLICILIAFVSMMCGYLYILGQRYAQISKSSRNWSRGSNGSATGETTAVAEELEDGRIKVGKILYDPYKVLGKGCDGTFVFKGFFEKRPVAVKRVLPDCFSIADREVDLLSSSDKHSNVIRYFCMEQCREFRYIALELCDATLEDYISKKIKIDLTVKCILEQATEGLNYLHTLGIVHRDVKPNNLLISSSNSRGEIRVMISDFGLCKKLEKGRRSFSKRSGITGTDGWIAPEMMQDTSKPVSIIEIEVIFYYQKFLDFL